MAMAITFTKVVGHVVVITCVFGCKRGLTFWTGSGAIVKNLLD